MKRVHILLVLLVVALAAIPFRARVRRCFVSGVQTLRGKATVADRVKEHGANVRERLAPFFRAAGLTYPPEKVVLVGLKEERMLEVWAANDGGQFVFVREYQILGTSGKLGPKLEEGDMQVPEGLYRIESLNPNSRFHLSLRLNYPNEFDRKHAEREDRRYPGSDIMIHGSTCSIGCLAMGDEAAEDLFILVAETGVDNVSVILSPVDFRTKEMPEPERQLPEWTGGLYEDIRRELSRLDPVQPLLRRAYLGHEEAVDALVAMGVKAAPALLVAAQAERRRRSYFEITPGKILCRMGNAAVPVLVEALDSEDSATRSTAAEVLAGIGAEAVDAIDPLTRLTQRDPEEDVRRFALIALAPIGKKGRRSDTVLPVIVRSMEDESKLVRDQALGSLARLGVDAVPTLFGMLRSSDRETCGRIGVALGWMKSEPEAVDAIIQGLNDDHENVRAYCAYGLGMMKAKAAIPALIDAMRDSVSHVRLRAVGALGKIGPDAKEIVPELLGHLGHENWATRATAASALGKIGPVNEKVIPSIAGLLDDESVNVRRSAIGALGRIGVQSSDVIPILTQALHEQGNDDLRACAASALRHMGPEAVAAVPGLIKALGDKDSYVRRQVLYALGEVGPGAEAAVPAIKKFVDDEDYSIREHAKGAIYKIMVRRPHVPERGEPL